MKGIKFLFLTVVICLVIGCAARAPLAPPEMDSQAKLFEVPEGKSQIYLFRDEVLGMAIAFDVSLNDVPVGNTAANTYFCFTLPSGQYKIDSIAENKSTLTINTEEGKNYFIWQEVKMGILKARNKLQEVDEERGKRGVLKSKLILPSQYYYEVYD